MQHLFRLSQKLKPETSAEQYGRVLCAALESYLSRPRIPTPEALGREIEQRLADGSLANTSEALQEFMLGTLAPLSRNWEQFNARRVELESLRPDRRLSTVHEEAVKFLRGTDRIWNLQAQTLELAEKGDWREAGKLQVRIDYWSEIVGRVQTKLVRALLDIRRHHLHLFELLGFSPRVMQWLGLQNSVSALSFFTAKENLASTKARIAEHLKARFLSGSPDEPEATSHITELCERLEALAHQPEAWFTVPLETLKLVVFQQILRNFLSGDQNLDPLAALYHLAVLPRLGIADRREIEAAIASVLDSDIRQVSALTVFMAMDPDPGVISTASLDLASLLPLENGDPLTGPKTVLAYTKDVATESEVRRANIITGILLLGDRRVLPLLDGCWTSFGPEGQAHLCKAISGSVFASVAEFYLQWLENIHEDHFGFPAGALGRLPLDTIRNLHIRDVERHFPAPFNLSPEDYEHTPPLSELQSWSIPEFGRIIEPRLRQLYLRETYDQVLPRVLTAWSLETGLHNDADQWQRIFAKFQADVESLRHIADHLCAEESPETAANRSRRFIARTFSDFLPSEALAMTLATAQVFSDSAESARLKAHRSMDMEERDRLLDEAQLKADDAGAIRQLLRQQFGPDLEVAARDMARAWIKVRLETT